MLVLSELTTYNSRGQKDSNSRADLRPLMVAPVSQDERPNWCSRRNLENDRRPPSSERCIYWKRKLLQALLSRLVACSGSPASVRPRQPATDSRMRESE